MKDDLVERCARAFIDALDDGYGGPYIGDDTELSSITIDGTCDIPKAVRAVLAIARPAILEEAAALIMDKRHIYGHSRENTAAAIRTLAHDTTGQEGGR